MDLTASSTVWWRCPIYFIAAAVLAFFAISSAIHSTANVPGSPSALGPSLSLNASRTLQRAGFSSMAALLSISPEYFSSASPNITIFALPDSALSKISSSPWLMKDTIRYHALPLRLSAADLAKQPERTCLPTLSPGKNLVISRSEGDRVEINEAPVTDLDVFLDERVAIHGVLTPFAFPGLQEIGKNWPLIQLPQCGSNLKAVSEVSESKKGEPKRRVECDLVTQFLYSHGFVPFAVGLKSTVNHDGTFKDSNDSASFTIFAPLEFGSMPLDHPVLDKIVRAHIVPGKYGYLELLALPARASLRTLVPGMDLEVTRSTVTGGVDVSGVKITNPEAFTSEKFIVHGIARVFDVEGHPSTQGEQPANRQMDSRSEET